MLTILLRPPKRITMIRFSRITLGKLKRLGMELIHFLSRNKNFAPVSKLIIGDMVITDPHELSNAFNKHFVDIGPNLAANINPLEFLRDFVEPCESTFELELLTIDGLRKLVNDIPASSPYTYF